MTVIQGCVCVQGSMVLWGQIRCQHLRQDCKLFILWHFFFANLKLPRRSATVSWEWRWCCPEHRISKATLNVLKYDIAFDLCSLRSKCRNSGSSQVRVNHTTLHHSWLTWFEKGFCIVTRSESGRYGRQVIAVRVMWGDYTKVSCT